MALRVVVSPHLVRNRRNAATGSVESLFEETLLTLAGPRNEVEAVAAVRCAGHAVAFDPALRIAAHEDGHADPSVPFEHGGETLVQVFLNHLAPADASGDVGIVLADGSLITVTAEFVAGPCPPDAFSSRLLRAGPGDWRIEVDSPVPFEAFQQRTACGRAVEDRAEYAAGRHSIRVGPAFCESYGVALSTCGIDGGVEHKHMVMGKFGVGSGRHAMACGVLFAPKVVHPFAYGALVALFDADGLPGGADACWAGFDEVDVMAPPPRKAAAAAAMAGCPVPWRVTTFAKPGDEGCETADLLVVEPGDEPEGGRTFSYLLFSRDDRLVSTDSLARIAVRAAEMPPEAALFDRSWLSAVEGAVRTAELSHGAAFSLPGSLDLARGRVADVRRRALPASACHGCHYSKRCDGILPYPCAPDPEVAAGRCALRAAFDRAAGPK